METYMYDKHRQRKRNACIALNPKSDTYIRFADDGQSTPQHQQRNRIVWKIWIGE
jgi:hypothetical protein